jgi:hypothetical protein
MPGQEYLIGALVAVLIMVMWHLGKSLYKELKHAEHPQPAQAPAEKPASGFCGYKENTQEHMRSQRPHAQEHMQSHMQDHVKSQEHMQDHMQALAPAAQQSRKEGFTGGAPVVREAADPYTELNNFIDRARGMSASELAGHSIPPWQIPGEIERYYQSKMPWNKPAEPWQRPGEEPSRFHQSGVTVQPEQAAAAEQEAWTAALESNSSAVYNTENAYDSYSDATACHESAPLDYNTHITETVLDKHAVENHNKWATSMMPWAGTSTSPDTLDEAIEASTDFIGLRRPQAIVQHNALQVTERDMYTFLGNAKFNFLG